MTQHIMQEHEVEDRATMRRLGLVIGSFVIATAVMAMVVGMIMG